MKLDIACGQNKQQGFKGIDIAGDADILHDLNTYPWPLKDRSVEEFFCSHYAEHIPHYREGWEKDGWWLFWEEVHRIAKPDAKITVVHPYVKHERAFWDPTHVRFIHENTWYYLDAEWRKMQGLDHYQTTADFEVVLIQGTGLDPQFQNRNHEYQAFGRNHWWNVIPDLYVELKVRKVAKPNRRKSAKS